MDAEQIDKLVAVLRQIADELKGIRADLHLIARRIPTQS